MGSGINGGEDEKAVWSKPEGVAQTESWNGPGRIICETRSSWACWTDKDPRKVVQEPDTTERSGSRIIPGFAQT